LNEYFTVNRLNELTNATRSGMVTVAGTTTSAATNVIINNLYTAAQYGDATFAVTGISLLDGTNTFVAVAQDALGRSDTNTVSAYLPANVNYAYDLNGNLLSDGRRAFQYDSENQLTNVMVTNAWKSDFVYDGKMRRRIRREYTWSGSAWSLQSETRYVYDGNVVLQERDGNNLPLVSYTRGNDLSGTLQGAGGIGGLLARSDNQLMITGDANAHAYYHADGNGNITRMINASQTTVAKYIYDPFGNILAQSGNLADANLYRFSSKEVHPNSGLVCYLYRYYDPNLQRWLNRDPLGDEQFLKQVVRVTTFAEHRRFVDESIYNSYSFVHNAVLDKVDLNGLMGYWGCVGKMFICETYSLTCIGTVVGGALGCTKFIQKSGDVEAFFKCLTCVGGSIGACDKAATCWQQAASQGCLPDMPDIPNLPDIPGGANRWIP
jgi:RHS repeat-associated protein